jgi:hypothetical protein
MPDDSRTKKSHKRSLGRKSRGTLAIDPRITGDRAPPSRRSESSIRTQLYPPTSHRAVDRIDLVELGPVNEVVVDASTIDNPSTKAFNPPLLTLPSFLSRINKAMCPFSLLRDRRSLRVALTEVHRLPDKPTGARL